jgi:hypothetical protein
MSSRLWAAVEGLADVWRPSDVVQRYAGVFADPQHRLGQQLRETLAWVRAIEAQRLLLAHLLQVSPGFERFMGEPGAAQFLRQGARLAKAFLWTVEWWRSRLPGYLTMPAPQLVPDGPLSTGELTLRVPWRPDLRRQGLQLTPAPPVIADLLGVAPQPLDQAIRAVGAVLADCPQVQALAQADTSLTDADGAALAAARDQTRSALRPEQIDAAAGELALDRLAYREAVVAEALDSLRDGARRYGDAFTAADRLVEQAAALFSQAVVNGPAPKLGPVLRAERLHGGHGWTQVVIPEPFGLFAQLGDVVLFDTPGLTDALHIEGVAEKFTGERWGVATLSGYLLPDSAGLRARRWPAER